MHILDGEKNQLKPIPSKLHFFFWHHLCLQVNIRFFTTLYVSCIYKTKGLVKPVHQLFLGNNIKYCKQHVVCSELRKKRLRSALSVCLIVMNEAKDGNCNKSCINLPNQSKKAIFLTVIYIIYSYL